MFSVDFLKRLKAVVSDAVAIVLGAATVGLAVLMPRIFGEQAANNEMMNDDLANADAPSCGTCGVSACNGDGVGCGGDCGGSCAG